MMHFLIYQILNKLSLCLSGLVAKANLNIPCVFQDQKQ